MGVKKGIIIISSSIERNRERIPEGLPDAVIKCSDGSFWLGVSIRKDGEYSLIGAIRNFLGDNFNIVTLSQSLFYLEIVLDDLCQENEEQTEKTIDKLCSEELRKALEHGVSADLTLSFSHLLNGVSDRRFYKVKRKLFDTLEKIQEMVSGARGKRMGKHG